MISDEMKYLDAKYNFPYGAEKYRRNDCEEIDDYCYRIASYKNQDRLKWKTVAEIIEYNTGVQLSSSAICHRYLKYVRDLEEDDLYQEEITSELTSKYNDFENNFEEELLYRTDKVKEADTKTQINALYRRIAREDSIKEIAKYAADKMSETLNLPLITNYENHNHKTTSDNIGILMISDWHYGLDIKNNFNAYNPEVAIERINKLQDEVIDRCSKSGVTELIVANLGDLIAGNIHLPIRLNSRMDVISQIMTVSEIYTEFLYNLSKHFHITAYSVLDNHSRIDPNKKDAMQLESLARITPWYSKERLKDCNIDFKDNEIDENIATFKVLNYDVIAVHGDLDKPNKLVDNLTTFTETHYDLILSAHLHHFSSDERNRTIVVSNGSLMGTDDYAFGLRLNSKPSQTLIISNKDSVCDEIHRIIL